VARADLSLREARRIALAAQGFALARPARPGTAQILATVRRLGLLQFDSVGVLVPAHYQPLFSRLGPYDRALLDDLTYRRRRLTEQWAHEASIIPVEIWPLLRHRMEAHRLRPWGFERELARHPDYAVEVLAAVRERGPLAAAELEHPPGSERRLAIDWYGTFPRATLEAYFGRGELAVAGRQRNLARQYDLAERVIPAAALARRVTPEEARRSLLERAARAHGVGTLRDLADYFRMRTDEARPRLEELREAGRLRLVQVEGWREPAWLHADAVLPRRLGASALLSPFDPVVWFRPRALRLFGLDHRLEIYTPAAKRRWGYYVLPFLLGDRLVARLDLRADRATGRLLVLSAHLETGGAPGEVVGPLAGELRAMAGWLGLGEVRVGRRGGLAAALAAEVRSR
jgi:uncharacterized protein YcaQ